MYMAFQQPVELQLESPARDGVAQEVLNVGDLLHILSVKGHTSDDL